MKKSVNRPSTSRRRDLQYGWGTQLTEGGVEGKKPARPDPLVRGQVVCGPHNKLYAYKTKPVCSTVKGGTRGTNL
jgi:hypothetical protein